MLKFLMACENNDIDTVNQFLKENPKFDLNENIVYSMPPRFVLELPLIKAINGNARAVIEILKNHGASFDTVSHVSNVSADMLINFLKKSGNNFYF